MFTLLMVWFHFHRPLGFDLRIFQLLCCLEFPDYLGPLSFLYFSGYQVTIIVLDKKSSLPVYF